MKTLTPAEQKVKYRYPSEKQYNCPILEAQHVHWCWDCMVGAKACTENCTRQERCVFEEHTWRGVLVVTQVTGADKERWKIPHVKKKQVKLPTGGAYETQGLYMPTLLYRHTEPHKLGG